MKPENQGGCVDPRSNVYGTRNLGVAGLCVHFYLFMSHRLIRFCRPLYTTRNVGGNTNSTAMLAGEKAATLIAEDLGLKLPQ